MKALNILSGNVYEITVIRETKTLIVASIKGYCQTYARFNKNTGKARGWLNDFILV
jgi:hypothetical protein